MIGELAAKKTQRVSAENTAYSHFWTLCQQKRHALDSFSHEVVRECDTRPHIHMSYISVCSYKDVWMSGLVTLYLPAGPYCCLDSDWLRAVWKSTSVELQGCRPLVLPPPCLSGFQPGPACFFFPPLLFEIQEEVPSVFPLSVFCGQILKLLTSSCLHHSSLQHVVG